MKQYEIIYGTKNGSFENGNLEGKTTNKKDVIKLANDALRRKGEKNDFVEVYETNANNEEKYELVYRREYVEKKN